MRVNANRKARWVAAARFENKNFTEWAGAVLDFAASQVEEKARRSPGKPRK